MRSLSTLCCIALASMVLSAVGSGCKTNDGKSLVPDKPGAYYGPTVEDFAVDAERRGVQPASEVVDPD
jgi:hypothetical protein